MAQVEINIADYLDELDDDDLLEEVERRKINKLLGAPIDAIDAIDEIRDALHALHCGRISEAAAILDRLANPKWKSVDDCMSEYKRVKRA